MAFRLSLYWRYEGVTIMSFPKKSLEVVDQSAMVCTGLSFVPKRTTRDGHLNASFNGS